MQITNITAQNFIGRNFDFPLKPVNVIVGPNASGKSAIINAVKIGLLGYHPRIGKQPHASWKYAGDKRSEMNLALQMEPKNLITHTFRRKPDGSVSHDTNNTIKVPNVLLDTDDYFQRTNRERIKFIFEKINPALYGFTDTRITDALSKIEVIPSSISQRAVLDLLALAQETIAFRDKNQMSHQQWMEHLLEKLESKKKVLDSDWKRLTAQVGSLRGTLPNKRPESNLAKIKEMETAISELNTQIGREQAAIAQSNSTAARRAELESKIQATLTDNRKEVKAEVEKLEKKVKGYKSKTPELDRSRSLLLVKHEALKSEITGLVSKKTEMENKIRNLNGTPCCPFCKSTAEGWKNELLKTHKASLNTLEGEIIVASKQKEVLVNEGKVNKTALDASMLEDSQNQKDWNSLNQLRVALAKIEEVFSQKSAWQAELDGLNAVCESPNVQKLAELIASQNKMGHELDALKFNESDYDSYKITLKRAEDAETEYTEKFTFCEVYKQAIKITVQNQESLVAAAFGFILNKAVALTDGILRAKLDYRNGEIGMMTDDGWVSHETFSGMEELIAYSGISVALAQESPIKIVMMDELGRLETKNKKLLMERVINLTSNGVIDQFIGLDVSEVDYAGFNGINIIHP